MKKVLVSLVAIAGLSSLALALGPTHFTETLPPAASAGAIPVSNGYDWSLSQSSGIVITSATIALFNQTVTQIVNSTASIVGQMEFCSNCLAGGGKGAICISTGTSLFNQFILSTGTVCI